MVEIQGPNANSLALPYAMESERIVLGAAMRDVESLPLIIEQLGRDDFGTEAHRRIFACMASLHERGQETPFRRVAEDLIASKQIESVGGMSYLSDLIEGMPRIAGLESYCETIRSKASIRRAMKEAQSFLDRCAENMDSPADLVTEAQKVTESLEAAASWKPETSNYEEIIEAEGGIESFLSPNRRKGIKIPFAAIEATLGGLRRGKFILLAAKPAAGKTAFAMQIAEAAAFEGFNVLFVTLEMSPRDVAHRSIAGRAQVSAYHFREGRLSSSDRRAVRDETYKLVELGNKLRFFPPAVKDQRKETQVTVPRLNSLLRALDSQGTPPDLIVVDYLQLLESTGKGENRNQEVSGYSKGLKRIAHQRDIPVLSICNLSHDPNPKAGQFAEPYLRLLRDSGQLSFDGDQIIFLWLEKEPEQGEELRGVMWKVAKNKDGMLNRGKLTFVTRHCRFIESVAEDES